MNLPQSTLHLPKTWWPAAAIIDPSFPMKLLEDGEGGFAATRERTHANLLQSVSSARGGSRSKKKAYRVSNELCKRG